MTTSAVLAVRDEEAMLDGALRSVAFCDEIVVVIDDRTTDRTEEIARRHTDQVHVIPFQGFAEFKNAGVRRASGDWIVFCDGDERITPRLATELRTEIKRGTESWAFSSPQVNFFWGQRFDHGGWREHPVKIARRDHATYHGDVHEQFAIPPERIGRLAGERWHFTHRSIADNLRKTTLYGSLDAAERLAAGAPKVTAFSLLKVLVLEFGRRMVRRAGWRDGMPGVIEGVYQPFGMFCTLVMLWEMQQRGTVEERYAVLERLVQQQV